MDDNTFYTHGNHGIQRTTDGGESWHHFMDGIIGTDINELVSFKNRLYTDRLNEILKSDDNGETWTSVKIESDNDKPLRYRFPMLTIADNTLYAIAGNLSPAPTICRVSDNGDQLLPIQEIPAIQNVSYKDRGKGNTENANVTKELTDLQQEFQDLKTQLNLHQITGMAISGKTFYTVYNSRLLKWKQGFTKWVDTGLDTRTEVNPTGFCLASSGKTVYLGRNDGRLFRSLNEGDKWTDITKDLPIRFEFFMDITFSGSRVFIATEKGVLTSSKGKQWRMIKDENGKNVGMRHLVDEGSEIYGAQSFGIYRFNSNKYEWEKVSPELPNEYVDDVVIHNDKLYITTYWRGIFSIPIMQ